MNYRNEFTELAYTLSLLFNVFSCQKDGLLDRSLDGASEDLAQTQTLGVNLG